MLRTLVVCAATVGLGAALAAAPAIAGHKPNHNPGGGGGGGDATYAITLTNTSYGDVASGNGIGGAGGTIDGITEVGSFETIALGSISTPDGSVDKAYNEVYCITPDVNDIGSSEAIDNIRVVPNPEISDLTVVIDYTVVDQSFTLLLQGPLPPDYPPTTTGTYDLTMWNNRGGGKGKRNRCGSGTRDLDGVTLEIVPTSP